MFFRVGLKVLLLVWVICSVVCIMVVKFGGSVWCVLVVVWLKVERCEFGV